MADPVVSFYKEDDITELNDLNPEDHGSAIIGSESEPQIIHIWNDKEAVAGSTPMYNVKIKVVTELLGDSGGENADGAELVEESWGYIKSITNEDVEYTQIGAGTEFIIGEIDSDNFVSIELKIDVPSDATPIVPDGDIRFKLAVIYDLTET
ncbi:hypothetical protein [Methanobacterium spitsbergense]|uniref:Uncharacterized protein n=1 Tax=Methanobacterium spitsbergense TaxID=2874285 RepID=A0A8T5UTD7_9EURY|nr:hypothetical protein [Methanobacterium spitsbergense]MBZ2167018.1 hypothetical protein [Methanobacterium spitsbergense]